MTPELHEAIQHFVYALMVLVSVNATVFTAIIIHMALKKPFQIPTIQEPMTFEQWTNNTLDQK